MMNDEKWTALQQAEDMGYFKGRPLLLLARELFARGEEGHLQRQCDKKSLNVMLQG